jgi:hypothetical protein
MRIQQVGMEVEIDLLEVELSEHNKPSPGSGVS